MKVIMGKYPVPITVDNNFLQGVIDLTINKIILSSKQKVYIRIDPWDTWNMDDTLAEIILPMLRQLVDTKHGAPYVENEDRPEHLRADKPPQYETDEFHHQAWDWVLDEMIYAFDCKVNEESPIMRMDSMEDVEVEQARISNGFRLFGKYYENLWD
jgi:hypothetical protein